MRYAEDGYGHADAGGGGKYDDEEGTVVAGGLLKCNLALYCHNDWNFGSLLQVENSSS